jgi:hypothetical protein
MLRGKLSVSVIVLASLCLLGTSCSDDSSPVSESSEPPSNTPAALLLPARAFPEGYQPAELSVIDLREQNAAALESAGTAQFDPPQCRPTADADLNNKLDVSNTAVSAWQSSAGNTITELVTTVPRDIDADVRATVGECAQVTITITQGSTAGTTVLTQNRRLTPPPLPTSLSLMAESVATTTYPGGRTASSQTLAGYAVVDGVTVQLVANSTENGHSDLEFADLFAQAVARVSAATD